MNTFNEMFDEACGEAHMLLDDFLESLTEEDYTNYNSVMSQDFRDRLFALIRTEVYSSLVKDQKIAGLT